MRSGGCAKRRTVPATRGGTIPAGAMLWTGAVVRVAVTAALVAVASAVVATTREVVGRAVEGATTAADVVATTGTLVVATGARIVEMMEICPAGFTEATTVLELNRRQPALSAHQSRRCPARFRASCTVFPRSKRTHLASIPVVRCANSVGASADSATITETRILRRSQTGRLCFSQLRTKKKSSRSTASRTFATLSNNVAMSELHKKNPQYSKSAARILPLAEDQRRLPWCQRNHTTTLHHSLDLFLKRLSCESPLLRRAVEILRQMHRVLLHNQRQHRNSFDCRRYAHQSRFCEKKGKKRNTHRYRIHDQDKIDDQQKSRGKRPEAICSSPLVDR